MRNFVRLRAAKLVSALALITVTVFGQSAVAMPNQLTKTDDFLRDRFTNGQFVEGFTAGVPDYGFSLEALIQRKALGETKAQIAPAVSYLLLDAGNVLGTVTRSGFLKTAEHLKLGLAGKWAFASAVAGADNQKLRRTILGQALSKIDGTGDLAPDTKANTYDRAWLVLGLVANHQNKPAISLAVKLAQNQLPDGGFNDGFTLGQSSADGTGIALQALAAAARVAPGPTVATLAASEKNAVAYLNKSLVNDHFESYGDPDVNGTAYAAMGLAAAGKSSEQVKRWLQAQIATDGGFKTPWSAGSGDVYATAQAAIAAQGKSYLNFISWR